MTVSRKKKGLKGIVKETNEERKKEVYGEEEKEGIKEESNNLWSKRMKQRRKGMIDVGRKKQRKDVESKEGKKKGSGEF